jgi:two-component system cell cycle sensor histidine kinase/response regulator CckA
VAGRHPGPIDLLVTDVMLPHLTAGELVARLSRTRPAIGVIYVSGYPEDGTALPKLGEAGALFLQKPFTPDQLLRAVRDVLEGRKGGRRIGGAMPFRAAGE